MSMKLPPLNALRCFEAAARLLSLKLAASELCVTASAVSQQIARLEEALNTPLLSVLPTVTVNGGGEIYLRAVQPAFHQIAAATQRLQVPPGPEKVTLSCTSGFAIQWLLPRLADFERRYPQIEIQIGTTNRRVDLLSEGIDFAVRHGVGGWPELQAYRLLDDDLMPVCSPQLIAPRRTSPMRAIYCSIRCCTMNIVKTGRCGVRPWGWRRTARGAGRCSLIPTA
jgi:LysR family glycine cleavage system transcriptional activator